jgi:hypothetical protein
MIPGIIADLAGFRMIAQTIQSHGRMDHVPGQAMPCLMIVGGNGAPMGTEWP